MKRKTVVLIGLLFAFAGAAQAAAPDIYDLGFPDDSKDTTVNVLELNAGQDHTLDTTDDVDRAVLVLTGEDTYPYTVRVEQVGTGIDPAFVVLDDAGATLTTDVFTGDPGFHDAGSEGEDETWSRVLAPGVYRIGVKHVGASYGASDAGYSLRVTQDTGAVLLGLGTISIETIGPGGGKVQAVPFFPERPVKASDPPSADTPSSDTPSADTPSADTPSADPPSTDTPSADTPSTDTPSADTPSSDTPSADTPSSDPPSADTPSADPPSTDTLLYPHRKVIIPSTALLTTQTVSFGRPHDAYLPLAAKWIDATKAWHVNTQLNNYTLVMLQIGEGEGGDKVNQPGQETFSPPLTLVLEMLDNPQDSRVPDLDDIPGGYRSDAARVMVWDAPGQLWRVYDPSPTHVGGGVFTTPISSIADYVRRAPMQLPGGGEVNFHEVYFALEPLPEIHGKKPAAARAWQLYE